MTYICFLNSIKFSLFTKLNKLSISRLKELHPHHEWDQSFSLNLMFTSRRGKAHFIYDFPSKGSLWIKSTMHIFLISLNPWGTCKLFILNVIYTGIVLRLKHVRLCAQEQVIRSRAEGIGVSVVRQKKRRVTWTCINNVYHHRRRMWSEHTLAIWIEKW